VTLLIIYACVAAIAGAVALWLPVRLPQAWWLLALAAAPQLLAMLGIRHSGLALLSLALCLAWGWENRRLPGMQLLILGLGLNLLTMALYGGSMPITSARLAALGSQAPVGSMLLGAKDIVVDGSAIWWLGDWMTIQRPPYSLTASPGDLLVAAGLARWLFTAASFTRSMSYDSSHAKLVGSLSASEAAEC
jgi:hypothetical protein